MLAHSQDFKEAFTRLGRDIKVRIGYFTSYANIKTQDNKLLLTENNLEIISKVTMLDPVDYLSEEDILYLKMNNLGELFRTYMKSFDLKTSHEFNIGDKLTLEIGTTVGNSVEYLDYGTYYVYEKTYDKTTSTYRYVVCDKVLFTMIPFNWNEICVSGGQVLENITCIDLINAITGYCGLNWLTGSLVNGSLNIYKDTLDGYSFTCRDILDMCTQINGVSIVVEEDALVYRSINNQPVDTLDTNILKDSILNLEDKYGPVNSLIFSRADGQDNIGVKDDTSIEQNGETQYLIKNNLIAEQDNRNTLLDNLFNVIKDLEFTVIDIDTIGIGYIEYLDMFTINTGDNTYNCLCLQDRLELDNGMNETFKSPVPKEKIEKYEANTISDSDASIMLHKLNGTMVLKTDSNNKLAQVRLDSSGDEGSLVAISADTIDFTSHSFNLDTDNITITSDHVVITKNGIQLYGSWATSWFSIQDRNNGYKFQANAKHLNFENQSHNCSLMINESNNVSTEYPSGWYDYDIDIYNSKGDHTYIQASSITTPYIRLASGRHALPSQNIKYLDATGNQYVVIDIDDYGQYGISIWASDKRLKHDIEDTKVKALDIINKIPHKEFKYNNNEELIKIGYVADDLQEIDNQLVFEVGEDKIKQPNEKYIIPLLTKAIQEQQEQIDQLRKELEEVKNGRN